MKGSDYIANFIVELGVHKIFVLTGGAAAHMIDSCGQNDAIDVICMQHEQSAAMAADGFARVHSSGLGVAMATSGPGATNLITGIASAWFDSIPVLYLTGQVNTFESKGNFGIRQMGFQETDIVAMTQSITKYSKLVARPEDLKASLEEAVHLATTGRQGPVLVDIPFNIQTADVNVDQLAPFVIPRQKVKPANPDYPLILNKLTNAKRPVLLVGGGVRCAKAEKEVLELIDRLKIPTVVSWSGFDIVPEQHPCYRGQIGVYGARAANFTVQNADFLLSLGSRLDSRQTGGKYQSFAREAFRVIVDIDSHELTKNRVEAHIPLAMDAKDFIQQFLAEIKNKKLPELDWFSTTKDWLSELPVYDQTKINSSHVTPYRFMDIFSQSLSENAIIYGDTGATLTWAMQAIKTKSDQRMISAFGNSPMGFALPAAIGGQMAHPNREIVCIIGDGGMQINLQELQTISFHRLPIKIIIMNNSGYGIIKQFQDLYLEGRHIATGEGYSNPDFNKIADAYGIPCINIISDQAIEAQLQQMTSGCGPVIINVNVLEDQKIEPKLAWGRPIEDQLPLLKRTEFLKYLSVKPLEVSTDNLNEIN